MAKTNKTKSTPAAAAKAEESGFINENQDMNLSQIQELIKFVSKSGVSEVAIEQKDFKITIKAQEAKGKVQEVIQVAMPAAAPVAIPAAAPAPVAAAPAPAPAAAAEPKGNTIEVRSPMIGTFYRSPSPD